MQQFKQFAMLCALAAVCGNAANADRLWLIGEALPYGWDTDKATALLSLPDDNTLFTGTVFLKGGQDFKFMTVPEWGNEEYGAAPDAALNDGKITLAKGTDDTGYGKIQVAEDANYYITVDTESLLATIEKSAYQESPVTLCSLFLVGDATPGGWDVMNGTPLYQEKENPCVLTASGIDLVKGSFKIATALKGACSWNPEYWYFRDADNSGKIALNQEGDLQWAIEEAGTYTVTVDVKDNTISITKKGTVGIESVLSNDDCEAEYYTLTGVKVENPVNGIFICKKGSKTEKVILRK